MCLIPVVVALYIGTKVSDTNRVSVPAWNAALLFGGTYFCKWQFHLIHNLTQTCLQTGMAFSRIFLWMFDLAQLQILQESLESHPRRNGLTSIQYTLQVHSLPLIF